MRVDSLATRETLFTYNGHRLMVPASNQKILTAAVAADRLGWDYRFTTRLLSNGALDADGTLEGDLFIVGNGDPSINPRDPDRWRVFDDWAAQLRTQGVRVITGHLIGDDNLLDEPGWGAGWSWDDLQFGYGAPATALQYNESQVEVMIGPGMTAGAAAIVLTSPLGSGLLVDNRAVTVAAGSETRIDVSRLPGTVYLLVRGQIAAGAQPVSALAAVDNPTTFYVSALREALARHDIFVGGSAVDIDELRQPPSNAGLRELLVDRSPPLSSIVDVMMKWSRNEYAETLIMALGNTSTANTGGSEDPPLQESSGAWSTTSSRGLTVLHDTLEAWGITKTAFLARDGSGLSRMDYVSADGLVTALAHMWNDPKLRDPFRASLPVAGVSGTLARRLDQTPAAGRVWAKTGSMSNVRGLSGYLETRNGETLAFSILVNNFVVPASEIDAVVDKALLKLIDLPLKRR